MTSTADKYQQELKKIREQYAASVLQSEKLGTELSAAQKRVRCLESVVGTKQAENESSLSTELAEVRTQLAHKSQLLDKVKILLQKAALKEKFLLDQVYIRFSLSIRNSFRFLFLTTVCDPLKAANKNTYFCKIIYIFFSYLFIRLNKVLTTPAKHKTLTAKMFSMKFLGPKILHLNQ